MSNYQQPPTHPDDDTHPTGVFPRVYAGPNNRRRAPRWIGMVMLLAAFALTIGAVLLLIGGDSEDPAPAPEQPLDVAQADDLTQTPTTDAPATDTPVTDVPPTDLPTEAPQVEVPLPTINPETAASLLQAPPEDLQPETVAIERNLFDPFTIIPERPRNEMITYTVVQGDTVEDIANRFGLEPESIAWSNERRKIQVLRPGDELNIPPVDGVFITMFGSTRTIADWVAEYDVDDPYVALDSPFNPQLRGLSPETVPVTGTQMFIPGGEAEEVVWVADIQITGGDDGGGGTANSGPSLVTFQNGQPGSCPAQAAVGGSFWANPMTPGTYRITRGYTSFHTGIDLAASPGTPVKAANGGRVVFAGWNNFGYGYMIAVVHGPFMTVYAHLSAYYVNCGQDVSAGQAIGEVGSSGNSSGPHLHFEIRQRVGNTYVAQNPAFTIGF